MKRMAFLFIYALTLGGLTSGLGAAPGIEDWDHALRTGDSNQVMSWIEAKENRSISNSEGDTPMHLAAMYGRTPLLMALLDAGDDVNATGADGETPIYKAVFWARTNTLLALLDRKPDLTLKYDRRMTIVTVAVKRNQQAMLKAILKLKPPLEEEDEDGLTPLGWARKLKNFAMERILREVGALESRYGNGGGDNGN